ncbi:hypothetical protein ACH5RR_023460 [Cinchona calisaya]|uniref:Uncharacterized protein n=1 Tax=Cinchona calisaya TaxID=153742 RepID=A0ABD2ZFS8_9GENT
MGFLNKFSLSGRELNGANLEGIKDDVIAFSHSLMWIQAWNLLIHYFTKEVGMIVGLVAWSNWWEVYSVWELDEASYSNSSNSQEVWRNNGEIQSRNWTPEISNVNKMGEVKIAGRMSNVVGIVNEDRRRKEQSESSGNPIGDSRILVTAKGKDVLPDNSQGNTGIEEQYTIIDEKVNIGIENYERSYEVAEEIMMMSIDIANKESISEEDGLGMSKMRKFRRLSTYERKPLADISNKVLVW